jgi:LmbE family N-acetylglucosaminyl deacetylase
VADGPIVFFHAHPDDEAIFSGGTIARLRAEGHEVVALMATDGVLGTPSAHGESLAAVRDRELVEACRLLGVEHIVRLGHADSGLDPEHAPPHAFIRVPVVHAAREVATVLRELDAAALAVYDEGGIYGHPDHVHVHRVGVAAAALAGVDTVYEMTVDREYLHFVETHLIDHAREALPHIEHIGLPTVFITTMLDVQQFLIEKRAAIAAHASQVADTSSVMQLSAESFRNVYGFEWYVRHGPPGPIETLIDRW